MIKSDTVKRIPKIFFKLPNFGKYLTYFITLLTFHSFRNWSANNVRSCLV